MMLNKRLLSGGFVMSMYWNVTLHEVYEDLKQGGTPVNKNVPSFPTLPRFHPKLCVVAQGCGSRGPSWPLTYP